MLPRTVGVTGSAVLVGKVYYDNITLGPSRHRKELDALQGKTKHLRRCQQKPRENWVSRLNSIGFDFADYPGITWGKGGLFTRSSTQPYWNEEASICVSAEGMWEVEKATFECHSMCLEAVDEVVRSDVLLAQVILVSLCHL